MDEALVRRLLRAQFPDWADLPLAPVGPPGTDHTLYRLGDDMVVRMPIIGWATAQATKEARSVPFLAPRLPLALPMPLAMGEPGEGYPWQWSIVSWIEGELATEGNVDVLQAAADLARFVGALHACDPAGGPEAGPGTGFRGLPVRLADGRVRAAIHELDGLLDTAAVATAWEEVLAAADWNRPGVWFHGDLGGNLIARDGRLVGVIDSGYGVGDPACDLEPGWALFRGEARARFFADIGLDDATVTRARGWAIAPALMGVSYYRDVPHLHARALESLERALAP